MPMGSDEAGRGPVMGPLVICTLFCDDIGWMVDNVISDSKTLTSSRREIISRTLNERCSYCILEIPASSIDEARSGMTMNRLEVLAFASSSVSLIKGESRLHDGLPDGCEVEIVRTGETEGPLYVDAADVDEERFGTSVAKAIRDIDPSVDVEIRSKHKADRDMHVVGAASIIAKVRMDMRMVEISKNLGKHAGSGYPSDPNTREFLTNWVKDRDELPPHTRTTWKTARIAINNRSQKTLDLFG